MCEGKHAGLVIGIQLNTPGEESMPSYCCTVCTMDSGT